MGRGRAKAKQTKVARELKYRTDGTDLSALSAELSGAAPKPRAAEPAEPDEVEDDPYAKYVVDEDDDR